MPMKKYHTHKSQYGITLLEALVAMIVMALGILGIVGVQLRTLTDTQTGVRRAQAIRLIEDLSERMKVNPNALLSMNSYVTGWNNDPTASTNCNTTNCTPQQLAQFDIQQWKKTVKDTLPLSDANVFFSADETTPETRRQLGVMISWRENERKGTNSAETNEYKSVFTTDSTGGSNVNCPADRICHLQYIQLTARCIPYNLAGPNSSQLFCPVSRSDLQ